MNTEDDNFGYSQEDVANWFQEMVENDKAKREKKRAYDKKWRAEHPEYDKNWYAERPELKREKATRWYAEHPEYRANSHLKRQYNINLAQKCEMWLRQWHLCAICCCDIPTIRQAQVDHNHDTDEVRGILCNGCNIALGLLKENKQTLVNMTDYLQTWD